jgi:hypothetical protein
MECTSPNAAVLRAEALSRKTGCAGPLAFSRSGDPAIGGSESSPKPRWFACSATCRTIYPRCETSPKASEQNRDRLEISDTTYQMAMRIATLDDIDMGTLVEDLELRHAQHVAESLI